MCACVCVLKTQCKYPIKSCPTNPPQHCNTLQHAATRCNRLQPTAVHCNTLQTTATHCNTLQHAATHCNTLQHTATHCNTRKTLQHAATRCNTLQHTHRHKSCPTQPLNLNLKYKPIRLLIYNPIGVYLLRFITPKPNPEPTS